METMNDHQLNFNEQRRPDDIADDEDDRASLTDDFAESVLNGRMPEASCDGSSTACPGIVYLNDFWRYVPFYFQSTDAIQPRSEVGRRLLERRRRQIERQLQQQQQQLLQQQHDQQQQQKPGESSGDAALNDDSRRLQDVDDLLAFITNSTGDKSNQKCNDRDDAAQNGAMTSRHKDRRKKKTKSRARVSQRTSAPREQSPTNVRVSNDVKLKSVADVSSTRVDAEDSAAATDSAGFVVVSRSKKPRSDAAQTTDTKQREESTKPAGLGARKTDVQQVACTITPASAFRPLGSNLHPTYCDSLDDFTLNDVTRHSSLSRASSSTASSSSQPSGPARATGSYAAAVQASKMSSSSQIDSSSTDASLPPCSSDEVVKSESRTAPDTEPLDATPEPQMTDDRPHSTHVSSPTSSASSDVDTRASRAESPLADGQHSESPFADAQQCDSSFAEGQQSGNDALSMSAAAASDPDTETRQVPSRPSTLDDVTEASTMSSSVEERPEQLHPVVFLDSGSRGIDVVDGDAAGDFGLTFGLFDEEVSVEETAATAAEVTATSADSAGSKKDAATSPIDTREFEPHPMTSFPPSPIPIAVVSHCRPIPPLCGTAGCHMTLASTSGARAPVGIVPPIMHVYAAPVPAVVVADIQPPKKCRHCLHALSDETSVDKSTVHDDVSLTSPASSLTGSDIYEYGYYDNSVDSTSAGDGTGQTSFDLIGMQIFLYKGYRDAVKEVKCADE